MLEIDMPEILQRVVAKFIYEMKEIGHGSSF